MENYTKARIGTALTFSSTLQKLEYCKLGNLLIFRTPVQTRVCQTDRIRLCISTKQ